MGVTGLRQKVTVVGAGNVGATAAQEIARRDYADVVLVDIKENLPQGKALDINQTGAVLGYEPNVVGSNGYEETAGSDVVVVTAGLPRKPGMSRDDLVHDEREDRRLASPRGRRALAGRDPDRRLEPARRHVPRGEERLRLAAASASSAWPGSSTPRASARSSLGDRRVGEGRDRDGARRPRRPDGPRRLRDDGRRHAAHEARAAARSRRWSSARARAAARSSSCSAPRPGTRRARPSRRWWTRSARPEARAPVHRAPRGRVRDRRPLHGRPREARRRRRSRRSSSSTSRTPSAPSSTESAAAVRDVVSVLATSRRERRTPGLQCAA